MTLRKLKFVMSLLVGLVSVCSIAMGDDHEPKQVKPKVTLSRAQIYAKALKHCKSRHGPEATANDLHTESKPWRVTCGIRDQGFKDSFN